MDKKLLVPLRYEIEYVVQETETVTRAEAILLGTILYWNGKACERGHKSPRYTKSGHCKECYRMFRTEEISQKDISKDPLNPLTEAEKKFMKFDVLSLRRKLRNAGLSSSGTKRMLIKRIAKIPEWLEEKEDTSELED